MASTTSKELTGTVDIRQRLNVTEPEVVEFVNMLFYGESGVGKTHLCGTAADSEETTPLLLVDCEGGHATLRKKKGVDVRRARTLNDVQDIHNELFKHNKGWYKTVALDSLTEIQDVDMRYIMKETKANAKDPDKIDVDVPSPREYGKTRVHMRTIVRAFRDLPMNTVITCLEREIKNDQGVVIRIRPNLTGQLMAEIPGFMDIVGYYYTGNTPDERVMQFVKTKKVLAKTRFPELGDKITNPTIPQIWELITSGAA